MNLTDQRLIDQIAERASRLYYRLYLSEVKPTFIASEIGMVHDEVFRLRLQELLQADDFNFAHDVMGIHRHLEIGKPCRLKDCFVPRFAEV